MKIKTDLDGKNILLADDDLMSQYALKTCLEDEGYRVITANNGQEAVELFDDSINAVMMDYQMPIMNGIKAAQAIREREKTMKNKTPLYIIGITGNAEKDVIKNLIDAGINIVFQKPLKPDDFKKIIRVFDSIFHE